MKRSTTQWSFLATACHKTTSRLSRPPDPQTGRTGNDRRAGNAQPWPRPGLLPIALASPDYDEYEVRIFDARPRRHLVAAIEIVSPANKDRPDHRNVFVAKCTALLQKGVAVNIVDLVTVKHFNLYPELLAVIGHNDPTLGDPPPHLYAASCRWTRQGKRTLLEAWSHVLTLAEPLPTLPLWLSADLVIPLDLEQNYEQACSDLWIQ